MKWIKIKNSHREFEEEWISPGGKKRLVIALDYSGGEEIGTLAVWKKNEKNEWIQQPDETATRRGRGAWNDIQTFYKWQKMSGDK